MFRAGEKKQEYRFSIDATGQDALQCLSGNYSGPTDNKITISTSQDSIAISLQIRESLFVLNINILITELWKLHLMDLQ